MSVQFNLIVHYPVTPETLAAALINIDDYPQWMQGLEQLERLDQGAVQVGSRWKESRKEMGQVATEVFEIKELGSNHLLIYVDGLLGSNKMGEHIYRYDWAADENGTLLTVSAEIKGMKGFAAIMSKLMTSVFKNISKKDLIALRDYLLANK